MASKTTNTKNIIGWIFVSFGGIGLMKSLGNSATFQNLAYAAGALTTSLIFIGIGIIIIVSSRKDKMKEESDGRSDNGN